MLSSKKYGPSHETLNSPVEPQSHENRVTVRVFIMHASITLRPEDANLCWHSAIARRVSNAVLANAAVVLSSKSEKKYSRRGAASKNKSQSLVPIFHFCLEQD